jgi:predicted ATPase
VPATLRDSLMARLDRQPASKAVAQIAATIGREFSYPVLSAVSELQAEQLSEALASLSEAGLIFPKHQAAQDEYVFKHALVQEIARDSMLAKRRQELHLKIAVALEAQSPDLARTRPEILAHHYTEAAAHWKGSEYWALAGRSAVRRFANREAGSNLRRALRVLTHCPQTAERDTRELELQAVLGQVLIQTTGYASREVEDSCQRARDLFSRTSSNVYKAVVLRSECLSRVCKARYDDAHQSARELARLEADAPELERQSAADFTSGLAHLYQGDFREARQRFEAGVRLAQLREQSDGVVQCLAFLGRTLWFLGYPDLAVKRCSEAIALARRTPGRPSLPPASALMAIVSHTRGDSKATLKWLRVTSRQSNTKKYSHAYWVSIARIFETWLRAHETGSSADIAAVVDRIAEYERTGARLGLSWFLLLQAEMYQQLGQFDEGLATLSAALSHIEATGENYYAAEVYRRKGELALACSEPLLAETCFGRAREIAQRQGALSWELRAVTSLSRLWLSQGQQERVRTLLAPVYRAFSEGFDTEDLRQAAGLLQELGELGSQRARGKLSSVVDKQI